MTLKVYDVNEVSVNDIASIAMATNMYGNRDKTVCRIAPIDTADPNCLSFCNGSGPNAFEMIRNSHAGIVLCSDIIPDVESFVKKMSCIITVENPRLSFGRCVNRFFAPAENWGIDPTAVVADTAYLEVPVRIGPMVYIGNGAYIRSGTVIGSRVHIGRNTRIGKNVIIQPGAVIGCTGQGFERNEAGEFENIPQLGIVVIEDNVEIGANCTIVRGTLTETRIGKGSKIGHLVDIGHNVLIGQHTFVSAGAVICGSVTIGDRSWLAPQCCIRNKITLGKEVTVGIGAVVVKNVPNGITVVGVPAKPTRQEQVEL